MPTLLLTAASTTNWPDALVAATIVFAFAWVLTVLVKKL